MVQVVAHDPRCLDTIPTALTRSKYHGLPTTAYNLQPTGLNWPDDTELTC